MDVIKETDTAYQSASSASGNEPERKVVVLPVPAPPSKPKPQPAVMTTPTRAENKTPVRKHEGRRSSHGPRESDESIGKEVLRKPSAPKDVKTSAKGSIARASATRTVSASHTQIQSARKVPSIAATVPQISPAPQLSSRHFPFDDAEERSDDEIFEDEGEGDEDEDDDDGHGVDDDIVVALPSIGVQPDIKPSPPKEPVHPVSNIPSLPLVMPPVQKPATKRKQPQGTKARRSSLSNNSPSLVVVKVWLLQ